MGVINEEIIAGLRVHIKDNEIHIHNDLNDLKFIMDIEDFKKEIDASFEALKKGDGLCDITGTDNDLCVIKRKGKFSIFLLDKINVKKKIIDYLRTS